LKIHLNLIVGILNQYSNSVAAFFYFRHLSSVDFLVSLYFCLYTLALDHFLLKRY